MNIHPTMADATDTSRLKATIYVGGLAPTVTSEALHHHFIPFGDIVEIKLPKPDLPSSPDPHRGFAYVEFEDQTDAAEAIDNMHQSELYGRFITVAVAKPQRDKNEGLGSDKPIWQTVCYNWGDIYVGMLVLIRSRRNIVRITGRERLRRLGNDM